MKKEGQKEGNTTKVNRSTIKSKQVEGGLKEEEKNLSIYCRPSKVVKINEFLKTRVGKEKQKSREHYIRKSGFGFLLDLSIDDPSKNEVMGLVLRRWKGEEIALTADHVQAIYGAAQFGKMHIYSP